MDWARMAAWLYKDGSAEIAKLRRYGIGCVYVDPRSTNAEQTIFNLQNAGIVAGTYHVPQWYGTPSPAGFAKTVSLDANRLTPRTGPEAPPLMLDLEGLTKEWTAELVGRYRSFQPRRPTAFTTEAYKWGDVVPIDVCRKAGLHWYVQTYGARMEPVDDPEWAMLAICRGYPPEMVHTFYAGERPPARATDGCIFTAARLP